MNATEILGYFPLTNNSVTIGLCFLLDSISAIISSQTINPNLGGIFRSSFYIGEGTAGEGVKLTPPIQNSLELWWKLQNWHVSTHANVFRKKWLLALRPS